LYSPWFTAYSKKNIPYFDISARSNYNIEKPWLYIARRLVGDPHLSLLEEPATHPADITIDPAQLQQYQKEIEEAAMVPLEADETDEL
jgi:GTP-binding nuclear protein Ran